MTRARTIVFVHAHPDDEVFLTGATMARLAAEGHRVVLVTATAGDRGLTAAVGRAGLGQVRALELTRAAAALGCFEVHPLGYADSGMDIATVPESGFARVPVEDVALRVAGIVTEAGAEVVCGYDRAGGYGHPDHIQVHRVTRRAAELTGTRLLEATVNRRALQTVLRLAAPLLPNEAQYRPASLDARFTSPEEITHSIRAGRHIMAKQRALAAHASQATGGENERLAALLLRLPRPLFTVLLGREWFVEPGRPPGAKARHFFDDVPPPA